MTQREGAFEVENDDAFVFALFDMQTHMTSLWVSPQYFSSNVRPTFRAEIAEEIKPEVRVVQPLWIPLIGREGRTVPETCLPT